MTTPHICYDISRLLTRFFRSTPNGIDRVDFTIANHLLASGEVDASAVVVTAGRPLVVNRRAAAEALAALGRRWGEAETTPERDPEYARAVAFLRGEASHAASQRARQRPGRSIAAIGAWLARSGMPVSMSEIPSGSVYVNCSQFPLWAERPFRWLEARKDIRGVFFVHDLLPLSHPEYFPRGEFARHETRLANVARFASAAIVSMPAVERELRAHLEGLGRAECPIHVAPLPVAPVFRATGTSPAEPGERPFFLMCATLEPRKNHLLIMTVWRALVERMGEKAPLLVLAGKRGWKYRPIADLMRDSPSLRHHVFETNHLSTPAVRRLMDRARAVLMPSFGEGYGLPVHEALTAGAPVIAADIAAFRDIEAAGLTRLSPIDGEAWLAAIAAMAERERGASCLTRPVADAGTYFSDLTRYLHAS